MPDRKKRYDEAYGLKGADDAKRLYGSWAEDYETEMVGDHGYTGPAKLAEAFAETVPDREAWVLDVGCGTGLVGAQLARFGFKNVDGLDLVPEMLEVASKKNIYTRLIQADLLKGAALNPNRYDAALSAGTFTHAHVGPDGLDEVVRLVKPGGIAMVMVNAEAFVSDGYQAKLDGLEQQGRLVQRGWSEQEIVETGAVGGRLLTLEIT